LPRAAPAMNIPQGGKTLPLIPLMTRISTD
jgi:hypothetical protein